MKRLILVAGAILAMSFVLVSAAFADAGPHGGYTPTTDACAGCHRAHTAVGSSLLNGTTTPTDKSGFCYSCHSSSGQGADTNVFDGVSQDATKNPYPLDAGSVIVAPLKGGGFVNAQMSTLITDTAVAKSTTSAHAVDGTAAMLWGAGGVSASANPGEAGFQLTCTNCHDPHGNGQYRILRPGPTGSGIVTATVPDLPGAYTVGGSGGVFNYAGENYANSDYLSRWCATCHDRYLATNFSDSGDAIYKYRHVSDGSAAACTTCHVAHGTSAAMGTYSGAVAWPGGGASPSGSARSSLLRLDNRGVCATCHVQNGSVTGGCGGCHDTPPPTGVHLKHVSSNSGYGATGNRATDNQGQYNFGCGECHSTDSAKHKNGVVEVDFNPANAAGSPLKSKNGVGAAYVAGPTVFTDTKGLRYTEGNCSSIYCHSARVVTGSTAVSMPRTDVNGIAILDAQGNPTYDPYTVSTDTVFKTVLWKSGQVSLGCTGCHGAPIQTSFPAVRAGVGQSHGWIDDYGYEDLHDYNMGYGPLQCRTCHYATVKGLGTPTVGAGDIVISIANLQVANARSHVNGIVEVLFDSVNNYTYPASSGPYPVNLGLASYNPANKSCSSVGCHIEQKYVKWGTPYRYWTNECDLCHRFGSLPPVPAGAPPYGLFQAGSLASAASPHPAGDVTGRNCIDCHAGHAARP